MIIIIIIEITIREDTKFASPTVLLEFFKMGQIKISMVHIKPKKLLLN